MKYCSKLILPIVLGLLACARQGVPTGGPKDVTPPAIDTLASTPNFATRANPRRFELKFNEWITLSEAATQVVVSPPLVKRPEVLLRGRTVIVKFDENEVFRENTTYTINFGTSVKDLHEGNVATDLRFVFSTGDYIDSLRVKGRVVDAFTGDPVENVAVMLYDDLRDSVLRKERPYYFSRTDKTGAYEVSNVKPGLFKVVAIEDLDQNLRWDGEGERIAFLDTALQMNTTTPPVEFRLFSNQAKFRVSDKNAGAFGSIKLKFNTSADSARVSSDTIPGLKVLIEKTQDSMLVWYDLDPPAAWKLYVNRDTIPVKELSREDFLKRHRLRFAADVQAAAAPVVRRKQIGGDPAPAVEVAPPVRTMQQSPLKPADFQFNFPIVSVDTSKWILISDSIQLRNFTVKTDSLSQRVVHMESGWTPGKNYNVDILPGGITDFWGESNRDTMRRILSVPTDKQLGSLNLRAEKLIPGKTYIIQLLEGTNLIDERIFTADKEQNKLAFNKLNVATYTARIIEDRNRNGRWDSGNYWTGRQPELIYSKKLEPLRANWEVEATILAAPVIDTPKKGK